MSVDIQEAAFENEVVLKSRETPVLVDFWAAWCGPCRMLTPVLEKMEAEYGGKFILAKVDTDKNQKVAREYKISGIPAVKLFVDGRVKDEFVGALPEPKVREFLDRNLPNTELQALLDQARRDPLGAARTALGIQDGGRDVQAVIWSGALASIMEASLKSGDDSAPSLKEAREFLGAVPEIGSPFSDARGALLGFLDRAESVGQPELREKLTRLGELFTGAETKALDFFLSRVEVAKDAEAREVAKNDLLTCFFLLGNQGELVNRYRRKLSSLLY